MHYGVPGMKWGHRKAQATSSIMPRVTWNDRLKEQQRRERYGDGGINGNASSTNMKRQRYRTDYKYRQQVNKQRMDKAIDISKKIKDSVGNKKSDKLSRKEYYKVGGNKMLKKYAKTTVKQLKNSQKQKVGQDALNKLLDPNSYVNKDGYHKQRKPMGTISENNKKRKPGYVKY